MDLNDVSNHLFSANSFYPCPVSIILRYTVSLMDGKKINNQINILYSHGIIIAEYLVRNIIIDPAYTREKGRQRKWRYILLKNQGRR